VCILIPIAIAAAYLHSETLELELLGDCLDGGPVGNQTIEQINEECIAFAQELTSSDLASLNYDILRLVVQVLHFW